MAADTIVFANAIEGQTLVLTGGQLSIAQDTTLDGDQNNDGVRVKLSGDNVSRILNITGTQTDIEVRDLALRDGQTTLEGFVTGAGGAVFFDSRSLTIDNSAFSDNSTYDRQVTNSGDGGAIYAAGGSVSVTNSTFDRNFGAEGGAIAGAGQTDLTVRGTDFTGNGAYFGGTISLVGHF